MAVFEIAAAVDEIPPVMMTGRGLCRFAALLLRAFPVVDG
jgi:hypothetical protein